MTRVGFSPSGVTGTQDVDIKTLGGSLVPAGPLPISGTVACAGTFNVTCSTVHATQVGTWDVSLPGTLDVDIKTLGGSVVPAGPLPVSISGTIDTTCSTVHTDAVANSLALADDTSNTQKFWIDTADDQVYYPTMGFLFDSAESNWDRVRSAVAWGGGTKTTGEGVQDVALVGRYENDTSGTLQAIRVNAAGNVYMTPVNPTYADADGTTLIAGAASPFGAANYVYNGTADDWDRARSTESIAGGTITVGLPGVGLVERNHYCVGLFTSTAFTTASSLVCSPQHDISRFYTKTICHYVNGASSTIEVYARCCDTGTLYKYYEDVNVASTQFLTISFTEALHDAYACVEVTSTLGTISTQLAMQS